MCIRDRESTLAKIEIGQQESLSPQTESFKEIKNWTKKLLNIKGYTFSPSQIQEIKAAITNAYHIENKKPKNSAFYKKKKLALFHQFPWTDICKWMDKAEAEQLFETLTGLKIKK